MDGGELTSMPGGPWGWATSAIAAVGGGFLVLRQYLSRGAADRADDAGRVSAINVYKELLEAERAARALADKRADEFAHERNTAIKTLGEMQGQLTAMTQKLEEQTRELVELREQVRQLQEQTHAKT